LVDDLGFAQHEINIELHPHITIATRDLDSSTFVKAWPHFKNREFKASFDVKSLV
jgi:2'-5' RNA ligase